MLIVPFSLSRDAAFSTDSGATNVRTCIGEHDVQIKIRGARAAKSRDRPIFNQTRCEVPLLAILAVLVMFFFPSPTGPPSGPYSVVHGPVTALQASRAAARLRACMRERVVAVPPQNYPALTVVVLEWPTDSQTTPQLRDTWNLSMVLRC